MMKQLGPDLWYGEKVLLDSYWQLKKGYDRQKAEEDREMRSLDPSDRFWRIARKEWERPWKYREGRYSTFHNVFRMRESGLMTITNVGQDCFPDIDECNKFVVQLKSLYVLDVDRGKGIGRKILEDAKEVSERSGCVVILFVGPFAYDVGNGTAMGLQSWNELVKVAIEEEREIVYYKKRAYGSVRTIYEDAGFVNMCLYGPNSMPDRDEAEAWRYEFAYVPESLEPRYRERLSERLKAGLSEYCLCQEG